MAADIPHLAWPFRYVPGSHTLAQVEQDSIEDVEQNVLAYLRTQREERSLSPDFGMEDLTFSPGVNTQRLAAEIEEAEDRASVTVTANNNGAGRTSIDVVVELAERGSE